MLQDGLVSSEWIYKNIFGFTQEQIKKEDDGIVFDYKNKFRRSQIENEGNDPQKSKESVGTPSDMQSSAENGGDGEDVSGSIFDEDEGGAPEGGFEGAGRPKEANKYGKDSGVRGRDPLGAHDKKKGGSGAPKYGKPLALSHYDKLKKSMKFGNTDAKIINEASEVEEVYKNEVTSLTKDKSND